MKRSNLILAIIMLLATCVVAVIFNVVQLPEMPSTFIGAALGAAITGAITLVLLAGQTEAEEVKERNVKVFEKKSEIFQEYIDIVWNIWEDHTVTDEEYLQLTSLYYKKLMLFLNKKSLDKIYKDLDTMGTLLGENDNSEKHDKLQMCIISIINALSDEISLGGNVELDKFKHLDKKIEVCRNRRQRTTFKMLKIKPGTELVLKSNPEIICKTVDEVNKVEYKDETLTISALSSRILERPSNGFSEFTLNGKSLFELRGS